MPITKTLNNIGGISLSRDDDERVMRDNHWVEAINKGDKKAFEAIYKCYYPQLFHFLMRYIDSDSTIEDIIQNVFYKIWQNRTTIEPRGTLKSYLYASVRNQALKQIASEKKYSRAVSEAGEESCENGMDPESSYELEELQSAYQEAIQKLPERRRHIYLMNREDALTYNEIAGILKISVKTVETQMTRSLKFLATCLNKYRS